jgi:hypothetical protein
VHIKCDAGVTRTSWVSDLPGYGQVWYNKAGIVNILSLSKVEDKYRITYESAEEKQFIVHKNDREKRCLKKLVNGLFYLDAKETSGTVLVNTIEDNKSRYTNRDYTQATLARKLQNIIGRPSARTFVKIVEKNLLKDCPIIRKDVRAADDICGPNAGSLRGKVVRQGGIHVNPEYHQVPMTIILGKYREVTLSALCIDVMFVNKLPFLVTISHNIKCGTVKAITSRKLLKELLAAIKSVKRIYALRGFKITSGHVDNEFEHMRGDLQEMGITLNVVSAGEHVPEIERYIRTVKERTRCVYNTVPFKRMPLTMVVEMVRASVFWLNMFPATDGVSDTLSPRGGLILGLKLNYKKTLSTRVWILRSDARGTQ